MAERTEFATAIVQIRTARGLLPYAGEVVRYTPNNGRTWGYCVIDSRVVGNKRLQSFDGLQGIEYGVGTDEEVSPGGTHMSRALTVRDFRTKGFIVYTTSPEEVLGKKFSYGKKPKSSLDQD